MSTASPQAKPSVAPILSMTLASAALSATGAPFAKTAARLAGLGMPKDAIAPVLHVAPVALTVLGFMAMRALASGRGPGVRASIYALTGMVIGFVTAFCLDLFVGVMPLLERLTGPLRETGKLDIAAWAVSALSLFMAALLAALAGIGSPAARAMAVELADPSCAEVRPRDRPTYWTSSLGLLGQGVFVAALAVAHQSEALALATRIDVVVAVILGAGAFAWSSWALWRQFDEMLRRTVIEAYAWSGLLATVGCLVWALLESFALAPALTAYGAIVALVALQMFVTLAISSNLTMAPGRPKAHAA